MNREHPRAIELRQRKAQRWLSILDDAREIGRRFGGTPPASSELARKLERARPEAWGLLLEVLGVSKPNTSLPLVIAELKLRAAKPTHVADEYSWIDEREAGNDGEMEPAP